MMVMLKEVQREGDKKMLATQQNMGRLESQLQATQQSMEMKFEQVLAKVCTWNC